MKKNSNKKEPNIISRPPIVVVMGHIDHGKSTLLDYIRKSNIVDKEAGGITQHVGAYEAVHTDKEGKERKITFLDTPGHEAFGKIRERGAGIADIAILVVSAEDGIKTQTLEALKYIKESKLPYVVAITKIDKPGADIERTKKNLLENEIYLEGWGGEIPNTGVSSITGEGIPDLLEIISLMADLEDLKADTNKPAEGIVIESHMDQKKGIVATLVISDGSIKIGDTVVADESISPVRMLEDFKGTKISEATVSSPIRIIGWNNVPPAGSHFITSSNKKDAEAIFAANCSDGNTERTKKDAEAPRGPMKLGENCICLPLIIRADVSGSLEAMEHELAKIKNERVVFKIVSKGVGDITESDIRTASGNESSVILGFNVKIDKRATANIERMGVEVFTSNIIYKISEWVEELAKKRAPKVKEDVPNGEAKILKQFGREKDRQILGGKALEGTIKVGDNVKIMRRENEIGKGVVKELQQQKTKTKEVSAPNEFGMMVEARIEISPGDRIIPFTVVEK